MIAFCARGSLIKFRYSLSIVLVKPELHEGIIVMPPAVPISCEFVIKSLRTILSNMNMPCPSSKHRTTNSFSSAGEI
ncbi:hypothetical protein KY308_01445 [Candidatus Woesearchaeota archaeon]|nr:hypothetical protein [Candidatus Woesearchaeota archaeon]